MSTTIKIGDAEEYTFNFDNPSNREVMTLERTFDGTYSEWLESVRKGSVTAMTCLVYVLRKRNVPGIRFNDVEFSVGDFNVIVEQPDEPADGGDGLDPTTGQTPQPDTDADA